MYNAVVFNTFAALWRLPHNTILERLSTQKEILCPLAFFPSPPSLWLILCLCGCATLSISNKRTHTYNMCLLCCTSFVSYNAFSVHPCDSMSQYFILFRCWLILRCCDVLIHLSIDGPVGCFRFLEITGIKLLWTFVSWFQVDVFFSPGYIRRSGIAGPYGNSVSIFEELPDSFPKRPHRLTFPPTVYERSGFSTSQQHLLPSLVREWDST